MKKIIWIDDVSESINYERNTLIPQKIDEPYEIHFFERIMTLMEFLFINKINDHDIFIIDIMLIDEKSIVVPSKEPIKIPDVLMAGTILYSDYLKIIYPKNPVILYSSREHEGTVFHNITSDPRFNDSLFLIDKWEKDTKFINTLKKLLKD